MTHILCMSLIKWRCVIWLVLSVCLSPLLPCSRQSWRVGRCQLVCSPIVSMWFEAVHVPEEILLSEEEERLHGESLAIVAELYHGLLGGEEEGRTRRCYYTNTCSSSLKGTSFNLFYTSIYHLSLPLLPLPTSLSILPVLFR